MSTALFILGLCSLYATLAALLYVRPLGPLMIVHFLGSWLQGELAPWQLLWQAALAVLLIWGGALDAAHGRWGLLLLLFSFAGLIFLIRQSFHSSRHYRAALQSALGADYRDRIPAGRRAQIPQKTDASSWMRPFSMQRPGVTLVSDIAYADGGKRNLLDIYQPLERREGGAPVLIQVHGGAWTIGHKAEQARPLLYHLAARGWVCVSVNYRLSPKVRFPDHIIDVKKAIAWVKQNIASYGGDPRFVAITGGSAGGHLSSLAALTPNFAAFQPGFETEDTSLQAAIPFYGIYNWQGGITPQDNDIRNFLVNKILPSGDEATTHTRLSQASPMTYINPDAPPMMVIHGSHDVMAAVEDARQFSVNTRAASQSPVVYVELPGAQHAFEVFHSIRADTSVLAVHEFLEWAHAQAGAGPGD